MGTTEEFIIGFATVFLVILSFITILCICLASITVIVKKRKASVRTLQLEVITRYNEYLVILLKGRNDS